MGPLNDIRNLDCNEFMFSLYSKYPKAIPNILIMTFNKARLLSKAFIVSVENGESS